MNERVMSKKIGSDLMLYDSKEDQVHVLNPTAQLIYNLYEEGKSPEEIEQAVRKAFRIDESRNVREEIRACIGELRKKGLIAGSERQ